MNKTKKIVWSSLFAAFIFVSTFIIKIPIPLTSGYIHLGDGFVFLSGIVLGPIYGGIAAAIGSGLSDLLGGYSQWIIPTVVIKFFMGYVVGKYSKKKIKTKSVMISMFILWFLSIIGIYLLGKGIGTEFLKSNLDTDNPSSKVHELSSGLKKMSIIIPVFFFSVIVLNRKFKIPSNILNGITFAGVIMIVGYYLTGGILYGNFIIPIFSVYWNFLQFIAGFIIVSLFLSKFDKNILLKEKITEKEVADNKVE